MYDDRDHDVRVDNERDSSCAAEDRGRDRGWGSRTGGTDSTAAVPPRTEVDTGAGDRGLEGQRPQSRSKGYDGATVEVSGLVYRQLASRYTAGRRKDELLMPGRS